MRDKRFFLNAAALFSLTYAVFAFKMENLKRKSCTGLSAYRTQVFMLFRI
jgi:hypothetical protein